MPLQFTFFFSYHPFLYYLSQLKCSKELLTLTHLPCFHGDYWNCSLTKSLTLIITFQAVCLVCWVFLALAWTYLHYSIVFPQKAITAKMPSQAHKEFIDFTCFHADPFHWNGCHHSFVVDHQLGNRPSSTLVWSQILLMSLFHFHLPLTSSYVTQVHSLKKKPLKSHKTANVF